MGLFRHLQISPGVYFEGGTVDEGVMGDIQRVLLANQIKCYYARN